MNKPSGFNRPSYGLLLAPTLVLATYAASHPSPEHLLRPLAISFLASLIAVGSLGLLTRRWHAASFTVCVMLLAGVGLLEWIWVLLAPWMFLVGRAWLHKEPLGVVPKLTRPLNILMAAWFAVAAASSVAVSLPPDLPPNEAVAVAPGPNVYVILLDGYPRADTLMDYFGFDNTPFLNALEDRGFEVSANSTGIYPSTVQILPTMLSLRPLDELLGREWDLSTDGWGPLTDAEHRLLWHSLNASPVIAGYEAAGYTSYWIVSPAPAVDVRTADVVMESPWFSSYEWYLTSHGLLGVLMWEPLEAMYRASILDAFRFLEESAGPTPRFVFAHILSPHDPYVFAADGSPAERCLAECTNHVGPPNPVLADRHIGQLRYINSRVIQAVDHIIAVDPEATVILFSDHGLRRDPEDLDEWFRTLFAARGQDFPDDVTTHDIFPILLDRHTASDGHE